MIKPIKKEVAGFRVYVRDEKDKTTTSAGLTDHVDMTKEDVLNLILDCLSKCASNSTKKSK